MRIMLVNKIFEFLAKSLKPNGLSMIGLHDDIHIYSDPYIEAASSSIRKTFNDITERKFNNIVNRQFIFDKMVKLLENNNDENN